MTIEILAGCTLLLGGAALYGLYRVYGKKEIKENISIKPNTDIPEYGYTESNAPWNHKFNTSSSIPYVKSRMPYTSGYVSRPITSEIYNPPTTSDNFVEGMLIGGMLNSSNTTYEQPATTHEFSGFEGGSSGGAGASGSWGTDSSSSSSDTSSSYSDTSSSGSDSSSSFSDSASSGFDCSSSCDSEGF